ncbi:14939_t:CDS:2 [Cetraspora pellucida]|uniref:14939_t:CDS:1 n=1 Tax=Cetraspora pellucida TaxID=1433469 RepID=A0ACA9MIA3_9GLOM|nr:14939_t:CDS:2 [Cetraspora pellucida]
MKRRPLNGIEFAAEKSKPNDNNEEVEESSFKSTDKFKIQEKIFKVDKSCINNESDSNNNDDDEKTIVFEED